jgi:hypothetical protein
MINKTLTTIRNIFGWRPDPPLSPIEHEKVTSAWDGDNVDAVRKGGAKDIVELWPREKK